MEVILLQDVDKLGHKDDIVNVKPGFAHNYLVPQGMAKVATASAKKMHEEIVRQRAHKEEKMIKDATAIATKIEALNLKVAMKASTKGKIFGAVTTAILAEAIQAKGMDIDRKNITVGEVKTLGSYTATVKIYKNVVAQMPFEVVLEGQAIVDEEDTVEEVVETKKAKEEPVVMEEEVIIVEETIE